MTNHAELVARALEATGFNVQTLAVALDTSPAAIGHWRTGRRAPTGPALALLAMLAAYPEETLALMDRAGALPDLTRRP